MADALGCRRCVWRRVGQLRGRRTPGSLPAGKRWPASAGALPAAAGVSLADEAWIDAAAAAGAEVVQWDELHLALPYRGGSPGRAAATPARRPSGLASASRCRSGHARVAAFLDDLIAETLAWMVEAAHGRGMQSSIVLLANEGYDPVLWRAAASLPGVRYFGRTAFWLFYGIPATDMETYLSLWAGRILEATAGTLPSRWAGCRRSMCRRDESRRSSGRWRFADAGVTTIAVWSYPACEAMSGLAPDDPAAAWAAVERGFAKLPGRLER